MVVQPNLTEPMQNHCMYYFAQGSTYNVAQHQTTLTRLFALTFISASLSI